MSKYASLLFSPEEYHEIGPFRFPIYHDLVPGEAKGIEEISRKQSRSTFKSIKLAQRVAKDRGISTKEAIDLLGNASDDESLIYDYATELEDLQREGVGAVEQQVAFVTVFMKYRAEARLPKSKEWQQLSDWATEDTEAMPTKLMEDVFRLISWERDGWPVEGNEEEAPQEFSPPPTKS